MQSSFFQNENRHRLIEYDLYESCLKRQLFYTKWCWAVIASALSGQNERSHPDDRKKKGVEHNLFLGPRSESAVPSSVHWEQLCS